MIVALFSIMTLLLLLAIGVPMVAGLLIAVFINVVFAGQWPLMVPQTMISGISTFTLISLPMFVLAGTIMNIGGISGRLFEFARSLVGWMRGGLPQVNVLTSIFFGGMIGSSTADLAGSGSVLIPAMKREGYPADFSAAVSASSSGIGPLIPPSSPLILYSAVTGTSLGALFLAGLIPGLLLGLVFMAVVAILARRHGWTSEKLFRWASVWESGKRALLAFGMPGIIVGGLVLGVFTPSEGGAFAAVYAVFLSAFLYRTINLRSLYRATAASVQITGELLLIVALSVALGSALSSAQVPQSTTPIIEFLAVGDSMYMRLVALMILAIIAGMFLDPLIPVLVPIILPTLLAFEIDLVHFGVLMVMAVVIGQLTPPMAIAVIISAKIAKCDQVEVFKANMPFFVAIILFTLVLIGVPEIATWLPEIARD
ncbi:TRAP transporter large permease [Tianweitania sediminis]|uniref:TRAP transporter large permease protein n=1 Tax=Tianweitania sediminis TaxID=1502156 RepID=A0A8J7RPB4_9HYPH|nr:TRAP transporter large permease [Tianweitania sediminis]MBP0440706.1 TRAP transporter large permease [Tianweitania sediminis]